MTAPEPNYQQRLLNLSQELTSFIETPWSRCHRKDQKEEVKKYECRFHAILVKLADLVRDAEASRDSQLSDLVAKVDNLFSKAIKFACGNGSGYGIYEERPFPSFAHKDSVAPLLRDEKEERKFNHNILVALQGMGEIMKPGFTLASMGDLIKPPPPWKNTPRPCILSTPCARFQDPIPNWHSPDKQLATTIFQARCEVSSTEINDPVDVRISPDGNILALSAMGGWKSRVPVIEYYFPKQENLINSEGFLRNYTFKADLASIVNDLMIDEDRRLIFVADDSRVKSYKCKKPSEDGYYGREGAKGVHTLNCYDGFTGPLAMFGAGSRVLRAGKHKVAVWDVDSLPTHGEDGHTIIGEMEEDLDTWRDDPEDIEPSSGAKPSRTINIDSMNGSHIGVWHHHPSHASIMLCAPNRNYEPTPYCHAFDVEVGGSPIVRYLGHGGAVQDFSTSPTADPNVFLTACKDGIARLYDTRQMLPVLSIVSLDGGQSPMASAILAHPDGVPFIFVGETNGEAIAVWDVRAQKLVYELATGNNTVQTMVWDHTSNTLYAATTCENVDRHGFHHDYRMARVPKKPKEADEEEKNREEDDEEEKEDIEYGSDEPLPSDSEFEEQMEEVCWPKRAHHSESYFGHVFDAGEHRIYRFLFKPDPNLEILPRYGSAIMSTGPNGW